MVAVTYTVAFHWVEARPVEVQCALAPSLPSFQIVGLANKAVSEARERVRAMLDALSIALPSKRITVNLSPTYLVHCWISLICMSMYRLSPTAILNCPATARQVPKWRCASPRRAHDNPRDIPKFRTEWSMQMRREPCCRHSQNPTQMAKRF